MPSDADTAEILAELAALREMVRPKRQPSGKPRRHVVFCVTPDESDAINAEAASRGVCISDLMRLALEPVLRRALPRNRVVPINLAAHNRRKPTRFDDGKSDTRALLALKARDGIIAQRMLAQHDARQSDEMLAETTAVPIVPKLPKAGG